MTFFPPIERSGEIKFYLLKSLPYYPRLYLISGLLILGLALQIIFLSVFHGLIFILGAVSLGLASGYAPKASTKSSSFWKEVKWKTFEEIIKLNNRNRQWDQTFLDTTNSRGFFLLFVVVIQAVVIGLYLTYGGDGWKAGIKYVIDKIKFENPVPPRPIYWEVGWIYLVDVLALSLPLWLTGVRRLLNKDKLVIQVEELLAIRNEFDTYVELAGDTFVPMLETSAAFRGEGDVPTSVQLKVLYKDMPKTFYGLQAQVNITEVQGSSFPYLYCVLVAKRGPDLSMVRPPLSSPRGIITEFRKQRDVQVMVIRQHTTKTSGFHVERETALEIFRYAYELGREINQKVESLPISPEEKERRDLSENPTK